ncbi:MAG TPA: hypothetical protein VGQ83_04115 [Polyangia bacterium]|jgi:hypothetical protein
MRYRLMLLLALAAMPLGCARRAEPSKAQLARQLAGIQPGEERDMGGGVSMKMHRLQAAQPLGDGWHLATSTEGAFSVELPLSFNDFRTRAQTTDRVELRTHTVGAKTPGLLAWTATCMVRRDGRLGPSAPAPAPEKVELQGTPPRAHVRHLEHDDAACVLVVEAQGADPLPAEADRLRFLRSFKRTGQPVW